VNYDSDNKIDIVIKFFYKNCTLLTALLDSCTISIVSSPKLEQGLKKVFDPHAVYHNNIHSH